MNPATTDDQLICRFKETGQMSLLDELFNRHMGVVRGMVYPMVLNDADADDLTQEIFIRAARGLGGFEGRSSFSTWLYRITMNAAYRFLRQRARKSGDDTATTETPVPDWSHPDRYAMAQELDRGVANALEKLSPPLRAAIVLTVLQEVPPSEAARIEGCTAGTMYWRVFRARKQLREELRRYLS